MKLIRCTLIGSMVAATILITSCSRKVTRVSTTQQIDISGNWNNTDSRLAADTLKKSVLSEQWISNFMSDNAGKKPVIIVGFVENKSHEHIDAETFVQDLEQAFIRSGKVRVVQGGKQRDAIRAERADQQTNSAVSTMKKFGLENGADFMLQGSINSIVDAINRKKVVYYQVNLVLTNLQTNEVVWNGDYKQAKFVKN